MTLNLPAPGNWSGEMNLQAQPAPGNWSEGEDIQFGRSKLHFHNMQISDHRFLEKVFKNLRQKLHLAEEAPILDLKTRVLIWGLLVSTTMKAAIHLGANYVGNLDVYRNTIFEEFQNLFDITQNVSVLSYTRTRFTTTNTTVTLHQDSNQHDDGLWRFATESSWTLWHPRGSRPGHPRYTGGAVRGKTVGGP